MFRVIIEWGDAANSAMDCCAALRLQWRDGVQ